MTNWWWHFLEVGNGVLAIVTAWLSVFLAYHLVKVGAQRRIWRSWSKFPVSMQFAIAFFTVSVATCTASAAIWVSRYARPDGMLLAGDVGVVAIAAGRGLATAGFLCALRIVTRPMIGPWPWIGALLSVIAYLAWSTIRLI